VTVAISTLSYIHAIILTSFPVVMMVRSCNVLSVILVGVLCSRVKDKKLKLGTKKIVVGVLVTAGIFIFWYFDPEFAKKDEKETELLGIILLFVSLLADGFLPDFQADIKITYKPQPMEMMTAINKWVAIVAFLYSCVLL
jgi:drug/metabolite transporter (DMT)-like permease